MQVIVLWMSDDPSHHLVQSCQKGVKREITNEVSRQRESFSSNRVIHEAIICCTVGINIKFPYR